MRYPMLSNWLLIQQNGQHNSFEIINELTEETFSTTEYGDEAYIKFITSLDGKTDYRSIGTYSPRVSTAIINELHSFGLLRESRWLCRSLSFTAYSLIIPKHQSTNSILPRIINALLWTLFLPVLIYGLVCLSSVFNYLDEISIVGIICGYAFGIICHEAGHAVATLSEGGRVLEFGLQIITPYRHQKESIKERLDEYNALKVEVDTVDGFQGRECDIVIFSVTRTTGSYRFLADDRRLNVAISRARNQLYMIGVKTYAEKQPLLNCILGKSDLQLYDILSSSLDS